MNMYLDYQPNNNLNGVLHLNSNTGWPVEFNNMSCYYVYKALP